MVFKVSTFRYFIFDFFSPHIIAKFAQKRFGFYFLLVSLSTILIMYFLILVDFLNYIPLVRNIYLPSFNFMYKHTDYSSISSFKNNTTPIQPLMENVKRILFWTQFYGVKDFGFGTGRDPFITKAKCKVNNCVTTTDRKWINQSDAVIFHPLDVDIQDLPLHRMVYQRYILFFFEAHVNHRNFPVFTNAITNLKFFNWTMTFRRDSDIYDSRYGSITRRNESILTDTLALRLPLGKSPPDPSSLWQINTLSQSQDRTAITNKKKLAAWFVSNCNTPSHREKFFHLVAKFLPIDIFGECGPLKCLPPRSTNCDKLLKDYKFYISAENSICADYITEKFYRALEMNVVPIVYGGADYTAFAPPGSYINAADFNSPQDLAYYILMIDHNPRLYLKYLDWNRDWEINKMNKFNGWCRLCEKLNVLSGEQRSKDLKVYQDISKWYYDTVPCLPGASILEKYGVF